ncbi:MAG TPA: transcription antitermination factor NusB [Stellaceae bacterium]|nr:transcription antitermination factor NusB [Stellaceae bacterium]
MNAKSADARATALALLDAVLARRTPLDQALAENRTLGVLSPRDRAFARLLTATVLRRLGQLDDALARCLARLVNPGTVRDILRLGAAQLLFLETPPHAAVATSVDLAAANAPATKGLVNAILRRLAREGAQILKQQDAARLDTPDWLWQSWSASYGEATARAIAAAHWREAPLDLSVKADAPAWAAKLEAKLLPTGTLRRAPGGLIEDLPGYGDGAWWVQDAAAALPARLFGKVDGATVADLCAAPGGKTAQLAAAGAHVIALDQSETRLKRLRDNLTRLRLTAECVAADAATWQPAEPLHFILLDAPCTATGAIRRNPDVPHLKSPADVARLAAQQDRVLANAVRALAPHGTLVYCVCSLEAEEGPARIARLLEKGAPVERRPIVPVEIAEIADCITPEGDLRTLPCQLTEDGGLDGFYACRLVRKP